MLKFLALPLLLTAAATPALAAGGSYYRATPAGQPKDAQFITRTTIWSCADGACTAPESGSSDQVMCRLAARKIGTLNAFEADGKPFDDKQLKSCNAHAR
ncbi:hypothetical protein GCM10023219_09830 [Stakelama sediminis]|uniref:Uncharacterized protein n=1 Tax=Stakelama sediminis TaxID=463200 RepID=A0A840YVW4_9SPHN|nr:hypothetical protein [Stakelama sediminis]MBB5717705.1 hypothetical protein [Stakelama sediminis]